MHDETLVLQSLQEGIQRPALDPRKAVLPENLGDRIAMGFAVAEHREYRLRERCAGQLLGPVTLIHG